MMTAYLKLSIKTALRLSSLQILLILVNPTISNQKQETKNQRIMAERRGSSKSINPMHSLTRSRFSWVRWLDLQVLKMANKMNYYKCSKRRKTNEIIEDLIREQRFTEKYSYKGL